MTQVDMVITDWHMPEMSGIDFIKAVRSNHATKHLPVLMVSGSMIDEDVRCQLQPHVRGWLPKPFGEKELSDALRRIGLMT